MPVRSMPKGALRTVRIPPGGFTPALGSLTWELAVPAGLHPTPGSAFWQAGHVTALVPLGAGDLLVGSHSGGVWHLRPDPSDTTRWDALPLSDDWDNPDISALASIVTATRVGLASQYVTQAAASLRQAVTALPAGMSGTGLTEATAALADHVTAMNTLAAAISRGQAG